LVLCRRNGRIRGRFLLFSHHRRTCRARHCAWTTIRS
jgi:hypothetical protein